MTISSFEHNFFVINGNHVPLPPNGPNGQNHEWGYHPSLFYFLFPTKEPRQERRATPTMYNYVRDQKLLALENLVNVMKHHLANVKLQFVTFSLTASI